MKAPGGGTIPPALCVTRMTPDIVILDKHMKALHIFELTMPLTSNIEARHKEKTDKYSLFLTKRYHWIYITCKIALKCLALDMSTKEPTKHWIYCTNMTKDPKKVRCPEEPEHPGVLRVITGLAFQRGPQLCLIPSDLISSSSTTAYPRAVQHADLTFYLSAYHMGTLVCLIYQ